MTEWTERVAIGFPVALLESANALAALIDPDTGGANTFSDDQRSDGYVVASIPFKESFLPVVMSRDPDTWKAAMAQVAEAYGREPLSDSVIEALCAAMKIGDEIPSDEVST